MILYNKYKLSSYLNLENSININLLKKFNTLKINYIFKYTRRLIRSILLLNFFIYSVNPFINFFYKNAIKFHLKLEASILMISNAECYDNYSVF